MGNVILDVSMSLDGFITGPNDDADNPLGLCSGCLATGPRPRTVSSRGPREDAAGMHLTRGASMSTPK